MCYFCLEQYKCIPLYIIQPWPNSVAVRGTPLPHSVLPLIPLLLMCLPLPTCLPRYISSPAVHLVSCGTSRLPRHNSSPAVQLISCSSRFGSSPLLTSPDIMRHTVMSRSPRGTLHLPLAFRSQPGCPATSQDIPRLPLPLLLPHSPGYPTTSRDPVVSPAAPCAIHDTTTSSGPSHYPPTSLPSDPTSPVTRPALPHAFRIPLPTCIRSCPTAARLPRLLCPVLLHARFPLLGFSLFLFMFCT